MTVYEILAFILGFVAFYAIVRLIENIINKITSK